MQSRSVLLVLLLCMLLALTLGSISNAGDLAPNPGPVSPTLKNLTDVEPRTAINSVNTPGDNDSVYRISASGSYYLTGNITSQVGKAAIEIAASNVSIDLNGFTISGADVGRGITYFGAITSITIVNGTIRNTISGDAVDLAGATNLRLERLVARANSFNGFTVGARSTVKDCLAIANGGFGISSGPDSVIENCQALDNTGGHGITVSSGCRVIGCTARNSGTAVGPDFGGISVNASQNIGLIQNCFVTGNDRGIIISSTGWTVINNVAKANIGPNYSIIPGNHVGAVTSDPAVAGAFANISN